MSRYPLLLAALVLAFFGLSCKTDITKEEDADKITIEIRTDDIKEGLEEGMAGLQEGLSEMSRGLADALDDISVEVNGSGPEATDFRTLQAIFPDRLLRLERASISGEQSGLKGLKVSVAEAEYEDRDHYLKVAIVDGGGLNLGRLAQTGWSSVEIDREDRDGYERTTTIDGNKAIESYKERWKEGKLTVFYKDRFIVSLEGKGLGSDDLRRALNRLDLDGLIE